MELSADVLYVCRWRGQQQRRRRRGVLAARRGGRQRAPRHAAPPRTRRAAAPATQPAQPEGTFTLPTPIAAACFIPYSLPQHMDYL